MAALCREAEVQNEQSRVAANGQKRKYEMQLISSEKSCAIGIRYFCCIKDISRYILFNCVLKTLSIRQIIHTSLQTRTQ